MRLAASDRNTDQPHWVDLIIKDMAPPAAEVRASALPTMASPLNQRRSAADPCRTAQAQDRCRLDEVYRCFGKLTSEAMRAGCARASSSSVRFGAKLTTRGSLYIFGTDALPFSIFTR
jgi:hypothetical protein